MNSLVPSLPHFCASSSVHALARRAATSLLFSVFDAWLVSEFAAREFDTARLGPTFSAAWAGNSFVAIAAGVLGEWAADLSPLHELVPGDAPRARRSPPRPRAARRARARSTTARS